MMERQSKLLQLLEYEGPEIADAFEKASIQGRGTPQEVADYRENAFRNFMSRYFPFPYRISKGNIIDVSGNESASIDCIIINPAHPYTIDAYDKFTIIFADGVDVAIEVKPDISILSELHRGLKQIASVKQLWRQDSPIILRRIKHVAPHILDYSRKIPCLLFSNKAKANPLYTAREVCSYYIDNAVPLEHQVDFIVINGVGILSNYKYPEISRMVGETGAKETGFFFEYWRSLTIAAFLLYLNKVYYATPILSAPVLQKYLTNKIQPVEVRQVLP